MLSPCLQGAISGIALSWVTATPGWGVRNLDNHPAHLPTGCVISADHCTSLGLTWYHSLLQGIFPARGLNLSLSHRGQVLYYLSQQESPPILQASANYCSWSRPSHALPLRYLLAMAAFPNSRRLELWQQKQYGAKVKKIYYLPLQKKCATSDAQPLPFSQRV